MASVKELTSNFTKLDKLVGIDFRCWQKKMLIFFTTLNVAYVKSTPRPEEAEDETLEKSVANATMMILYVGDIYLTG